jgi:hypothetical protein
MSVGPQVHERELTRLIHDARTMAATAKDIDSRAPTMLAASSTRLPVICAVNSPSRPSTPIVSVAPAITLSTNGKERTVISATSLAGQCDAPRCGRGCRVQPAWSRPPPGRA